MIKYMYRKTLMLQDKEENFLSLLITHMPDTVPNFWRVFLDRIKLQYPKEFTKDRSDRSGYGFLSLHYHWYNRFAEKVSYIFNKLNWLIVFDRELELPKTPMQIISRIQTLLELISLKEPHTSLRI